MKKKNEIRVLNPFHLLYTVWAAFWFLSVFLVIYPLVYLFCQRVEWKKYASALIKFWSYIFFPAIFLRVKVTYHFKPDPKKVYVFCANHFSYFDIPILVYLINNQFSFLGKNAMAKIPLFGYMYKKLHILVDRNDKGSRVASLSKAIRALQSGRSIAIFPEGGIVSKQFPYMGYPLKDGAIQMAIQQQVPIVPISLMNNYHILNSERFILRPGVVHVEIHQPIETAGKTVEDLPALRQQLFYTIQDPILDFYNIPIEHEE
jgi:1-acyl-sn-glycerol-3-phosphate acyltransferase